MVGYLQAHLLGGSDDEEETGSNDDGPFFPDAVPFLHQVDDGLLGIRRKDKKFCFDSGIKINEGKFEKFEDAKIKRNFRQFRKEYPDKDNDWLLGYHQKQNDGSRKKFFRETHFFQRLAHGLPARPLPNIYWRARRLLHSKTEKFIRYTEEEDEQLKDLYRKFGEDYVTISDNMDRRCPANISSRVSYLKKIRRIQPVARYSSPPKETKRAKIPKLAEFVNYSSQQKTLIRGKISKSAEFVNDANSESDAPNVNSNAETFEMSKNSTESIVGDQSIDGERIRLKSLMKRILSEYESNELKIHKLKKHVARELNLPENDFSERERLFARIDSKLAKNSKNFLVNGKFVRLNNTLH